MAANKKPRKAYTPKRARTEIEKSKAELPIGEEYTQCILAPFSAHLYEVATGYGYEQSMKIVTIFIWAAGLIGKHYGDECLINNAIQANIAWGAASEISEQAGITDRVLVNESQLKNIRILLRRLYVLMPYFETKLWPKYVLEANSLWESMPSKLTDAEIAA